MSTQKPFEILLEYYVLQCIGALSDEQVLLVKRTESKLQDLYKSNGSWFEIVAQQAGLSESATEEIGKLWVANFRKAKAAGENLLPQDFARMFVKENFSST